MSDPLQHLQAAFTGESLPNECMRLMYEYWHDHREAAPMPPVGAIDALLLPRDCLPFLAVFGVEREPLRFHVRLVGTAIVKGIGQDYTGCYVDEIPGTEKQLVRFEWCVRHARPYVASDRLSFSPWNYKHYDVLALPFAGDDGQVSRIEVDPNRWTAWRRLLGGIP